MFSTLSLMLSFLLWKLFTGGVLIVLYGIFFGLALLLWWAGTDSYRNEKTKLNAAIIWAIIALGISIPYWDWVSTGGPTLEAYHAFTQRWHEYEAEVKMKQLNSVKPIRTNHGVELRRYELVGWNPPKHFYVSLEDVETHETFTHLYVSKHCNLSYTLKKGEEYNIEVTKYTMSNEPNKVYLEFQNLYSVFCQ